MRTFTSLFVMANPGTTQTLTTVDMNKWAMSQLQNGIVYNGHSKWASAKHNKWMNHSNIILSLKKSPEDYI